EAAGRATGFVAASLSRRRPIRDRLDLASSLRHTSGASEACFAGSAFAGATDFVAGGGPAVGAAFGGASREGCFLAGTGAEALGSCRTGSWRRVAAAARGGSAAACRCGISFFASLIGPFERERARASSARAAIGAALGGSTRGAGAALGGS